MDGNIRIDCRRVVVWTSGNDIAISGLYHSHSISCTCGSLDLMFVLNDKSVCYCCKVLLKVEGIFDKSEGSPIIGN
jgi:hypothetical protein